MIVGADRIARNGDFANKIGTYEKAVLARENGLPFYVAAPWSTFDTTRADGRAIPVEERADDEVLAFGGVRVRPALDPRAESGVRRHALPVRAGVRHPGRARAARRPPARLRARAAAAGAARRSR